MCVRVCFVLCARCVPSVCLWVLCVCLCVCFVLCARCVPSVCLWVLCVPCVVSVLSANLLDIML